MLSFADSTQPALIPDTFTHVAAYVNGLYAWDDSDLARFAAYFKIGVFSGEPDQARYARCLDMEQFDATAQDFPAFCQARYDLGHKDALGYTSILGPNGTEGIVAILTAMGGLELPWKLWVAWYWGRHYPPTAGEVMTEIIALTGRYLQPGRIAGCQWQAGEGYDSNVWYINDTFTGNDIYPT